MKKEIIIFRKLKKLLKKEENNYDKTQENNYDKSESVWSRISRQIDELEDKVREIEYLEQNELAKQYSDRVNNLREKYREKAILEENTFTNHDFDEILNELFTLKYELDEYLNGEGIIIDKKITNERYTRKLEKMTPESCEKSTEELWIETRKILEDMKKKCEKNPHLEFENLKKLIAKHVLRILMIQAKRGEEIDLTKAEELCSKEGLLCAIKDKLIEMARHEENVEKKEELFEKSRYLDEESLQKPEVWQILSGVQDVKFVGEKKDIEIKKPRFCLPQIKYEGLGIEKLPWISVYTLGDIDEDGQWVNLRNEYGLFPKDFEDENDRILQIEINGVSEIKVENRLKRYSNLKSVIIGDSVKSIGNRAFENCKNLKTVRLGKNLKEIGDKCFDGCNKNIKISGISVYTIGDINEDGEWDNVKKKYGRFPKDFGDENCRVLQIEINGVSEITKEQELNRYFSLKEVILGEDVENIEEFAFMDCEKLEIVKSLNPKIDLFDIGEGAFRHCKNLSILKFKDNVYYPPNANSIYSYRKRCGEEWDIDDYYAMDEYLENLSFRRRFTEFLE